MNGKSDDILRGICLVFIQYMNIYSAMRREPKKTLGNHNESLASLWITYRTFQNIEGALGKVC